jgi:hypothetical protein
MNKFIFALLCISLSFAACSKKIINSSNKNPLLGTWHLLSIKTINSDGKVYSRTEFKQPSIRIYDVKYFAFGRQNDMGSLDGSGGGIYSLKGDTITSTYYFHTLKQLVGVTLKTHVKFESGKLYESVVLPWARRLKRCTIN